MRWLPREGWLWLVVALFTAAAFGGGYLWGKSGESLGKGLTPRVDLPVSSGRAWEAPPSRNFALIFRNNAILYGSLAVGLVTAGLWTLATYGWGVAAIGYAVGLGAKAHVPSRLVWAMVAPHGFLEVLSFAFVAVIGVRLLWVGFEYLRSGKVILVKGEVPAWALRIAVGFCLMAAAAAVEAYVTPKAIRAEIQRTLEGDHR